MLLSPRGFICLLPVLCVFHWICWLGRRLKLCNRFFVNQIPAEYPGEISCRIGSRGFALKSPGQVKIIFSAFCTRLTLAKHTVGI